MVRRCPNATWSPFCARTRNSARVFSQCTSAVNPFSDELLGQLYKNHGQYVEKFTAATKLLEQQGFLLHKDAIKLRLAAAHAPIP